MLTSLYAELVKNMEVTKALNSREEPIITFIDIPRQATKELRSPYVNGFIFSAITIIVGILLSALVNYISTLNKLLNAEIIEA